MSVCNFVLFECLGTVMLPIHLGVAGLVERGHLCFLNFMAASIMQERGTERGK